MTSTLPTSRQRSILRSPVFEANWHALPVLVCAALFTAFLFICPASAQVQQAWVARYTGVRAGWENYVTAMTVDTAGNSYVTGYSYRDVVGVRDFDYVTIKYGPGGNQVWLSRYNGPLSLGGDGPNDQPSAITVDLSGNVYVTGNSWSASLVLEYTTVKYSPFGSQLWVSTYHAPSSSSYDAATAIGVDGAGNVYVTGRVGEPNDSQDYVTIKYSPNGSQLWSARYSSPENGNDRPAAMFVDGSGNCYVTGNSATVKYDTQGTLLWATPGPEGTALKVDLAGNVYTTGPDGTTKFDPFGNLLWHATNANGIALALSTEGTIYVTEASGPWPQEDFITVKLDPAGNVIWCSRFSGPFNNRDIPVGIQSDTSGNVIVGGASWGDLVVVKYDPNGNLVWVARHVETNAMAAAFRLDANGNTYVAGTADSPISTSTHDYVLAKFVQSAVSGSPTITTQPTPRTQAVPVGSDISYVALATGTPPLRYQWRFDGHEILNATNATLLLTNVSLSQQGDYSVIVSNGVGWTLSPEAQLIVNMTPLFILQPTNQVVYSGSNCTLRANAAGSLPLTYQWLQNGVALPGATNTVLAIAQAQRLNAGDYVLVARNAFGAATSQVATVMVLELPPVVTVQPQDQFYVQGHVAKFSAAASGSLPLSYQWRFNGVEIPGATNTSLRLMNVQPANVGEFAIVATNAFGSVTSAVVRLCLDCLDRVVVAWGDNGSAQWDVPAGLTNVTAVTAGLGHSLALRVDGTIAAWTKSSSADYDGNTKVPSEATNVVAIAAGRFHSLALRSDGTVVGWGSNDGEDFYAGQAKVPNGLTNVTAVAAGGYHSLALRANRTVIAWGQNWAGQTNVPTGLTNVVAIAAGWEHSVALRADGTVVAWGWGGAGQTNVPVGLSNVVAIAAGGHHNLALRADGTVAVWGSPIVSSISTNVPTGLRNVVAIAAGQDHNLALRADSTVVAWGGNYFGQTNMPFGLHTVVAVAAGVSHSLAVVSQFPSLIRQPSSQTVYFASTLIFDVTAVGSGPLQYQWQFNGEDIAGATNASLILPDVRLNASGSYRVIVSVGDRTTVSKDAVVTVIEGPPVIVLGPTNAVSRPGGTASFRVVIAGSLPLTYQWRFNDSTIDGATNAVLTLQDLRLSQAGQYSVVVSNRLGTVTSSKGTLFIPPVVAWGWNNNGQTNVPYDLSEVIAISAGVQHNLALRKDGTVMAWGYNFYRQSNVPVGLSNVIAVAGGFHHSLALRADGMVLAWGSNQYGQTNVPNDAVDVVAIAAGDEHNLALRSDGTVVAWGSQTIVPIGLANIVAIAATGSENLALRADGTVVAWSGSSYRTNNLPVGLSDIVAIAKGGGHNLALRADGMVIAWGANSSGQTNVPPGLSNIVAIAAGSAHSLALRNDGVLVAWGTNNTGFPPNAGQYTVPAGLKSAAAISAGSGHSLALVSEGPPVVLETSGHRSASSGSRVVLRAVAAGAAPMLYQWLRDGVPIAGGTNADLVLASAQVSDTGAYQVAVRNAAGSSTSSELQLSVRQAPPVVLVAPSPQHVRFGDRVMFRVSAEGSKPLRYKWRFNGVDIPDATTDILTIHRAQVSHLGEYDVVVTNEFGTVTSLPARLTMVPVVAWGYNRSGQTNVPADLRDVIAVAAGTEHNLALHVDGTVTGWGRGYGGALDIPTDLTNAVAIAAGYAHSLALRADGTVVAWGFNGFHETDVPAGLRDVVAVAAGSDHNLALRKDGRVIAWGWNGYGQLNVPVLTNVRAVAAGNAHSVALLANGTVVRWGLAEAASGPNELSDVAAIAAAGDWTLALKGDGTVYFCCQPESILAGLSDVVAIATGGGHSLALRANGTLAAFGDDWAGQTDIPLELSNCVSIATGSAHSLALLSTLTEGRPIVTVQPISRTAVDGDNLGLTVITIGPGVLSYQWQQGGTNLVGATSNRLSLVNVQPEQAGDYRVIVSNALGAVTSKVARLTVLVRPRLEPLPESTVAAVGEMVMLFANATGTPPLRYQWRKNGANIPGATNATFTITNAQISDGGSYSVVVANDVGAATSGELLLIVAVAQQPPGDNFADRVLITTNRLGGINRWATREAGEPYHGGKFGSNSVWYRWTAPSNGIATFRTVGSTFDTLLGVYTGTNVASLAPVAEDEDRGGFFTSELRFNARTNVEYAIAIDGFVGGQGAFILSWVLEPTDQALPVITDGPRSQTVLRDNDVTLSVTAVGTGLTYQWHFNGTAIVGANTSMLTLDSVQPQGVGLYTVAITNSAGRGIESLPAAVEIGPFPGVLGQDKLEDLFTELRAPSLGAPFGAASFNPTFISPVMGTPAYHIAITRDATSQSWEPNHCGTIGGASKWFEFRAETNATIVIDTQGSTFDTVLAVYRAPGFLGLAQREVACNADWSAGAGWSRVIFEAQRGTNYWVVVDGANPADLTGRAQLNWVMGRLPKIEVAPEFDHIQIGQSRRFWAGVTNAIPPPRYRWFHKGQPIAHATNEWLDLPNLSLDDAGTYSVVVSNALGEVGQIIANLTAPMLTSEVKTVGDSYSYKLTLAPVEFPGRTMVLESSTDLINWTLVQTHTNALAPVSLDFPITPPQRFFRIRPPGP